MSFVDANGKSGITENAALKIVFAGIAGFQ